MIYASAKSGSFSTSYIITWIEADYARQIQAT